MKLSPINYSLTNKNNVNFKANHDFSNPNGDKFDFLPSTDVFIRQHFHSRMKDELRSFFNSAIEELEENIQMSVTWLLDNMEIDEEKRALYEQAAYNVVSKGHYFNFITDVGRVALSEMQRYPSLEAYIKDFILDAEIADYIIYILQEHGIDDKQQFAEITTAFDYEKYPELKHVCLRKSENCVCAYKVAKNKEHVLKYPDLLSEAYNRENSYVFPDFSVIDKLGEHLQRVGAKDSDDFLDKCGELAPVFNDFEFLSDALDVLEYHESTYETKMRLLQEVFEEKGIKGADYQEFYKRNIQFIDALFEENNGDNLGNLGDIVHHLLDKKQLKQSVLNRVQDRFNSFETVKDRLNLYTLLSKTKVSISELTTLSEENTIEGIHPIDKILKKNEIVTRIAQTKGISNDKALEIYRKHSSILTFLSSGNSEEKQEYLSIFLERFDDGLFKNQNSIVQFYNLCNKTKKVSLSQEEVSELFELLRYSRNTKIIEEAKKERITPLALLQKNKKDYKSIKKDIELFLQNNKTDFFADMSSLDIFNKYKTVLLKNKNNIERTLINLVLTSGNTEEYKHKVAKLDLIRQYFKNSDDLIEFMQSNQIKISKNQADERDFASIIFVLKSIYDKDNPDESYKLISNLSKNQFFLNSKSAIQPFVKKHSNSGIGTQELFKIIAKKDISSLEVLEELLIKYQNSNGDTSNVFLALSSLPKDCSFDIFNNSLCEVEKLLNKYATNLKVDNDNILNLPSWVFDDDFDKEENINLLITSLMGKPELPNYVSNLSKSKKAHVSKVIPYYIANEIINYANKENPYKNIVRELKLDKKSLGIGVFSSDEEYKMAILNNIPKEFLDFLNSDDWILSDKDGYANLNLHPRLRLIERFALNKVGSIDELYTKETKEKLKAIQNAVYNTVPEKIENSYDRIRISTKYDNQIIVSVFAKTGALITIFPQD